MVSNFKVEKIKVLRFPTFLSFDLAWFGFVVVFFYLQTIGFETTGFEAANILG